MIRQEASERFLDLAAMLDASRDEQEATDQSLFKRINRYRYTFKIRSDF